MEEVTPELSVGIIKELIGIKHLDFFRRSMSYVCCCFHHQTLVFTISSST